MGVEGIFSKSCGVYGQIQHPRLLPSLGEHSKKIENFKAQKLKIGTKKTGFEGEKYSVRYSNNSNSNLPDIRIFDS